MINISLLQFPALNQKIISSGTTGSFSPEDIIDTFRTIYKVVLDDGQQIISEVAKPDQEELKQLVANVPAT